MIRKDRLDVGILVTPTLDNSVTEEAVFYEEFYAYLSAGLAEQVQENFIEIEDLLENKLWMLEEGNCFRNQTFNLCGLDQVGYKELHFQYESGNLQTIIKMVDYEGGLTLIPRLAANDLPEEHKERLRFISRSHPVREVSTVYSRKFAKLDLIKRLQEEIRANLPAEILNNRAENVVEIYGA
jgi:LysR family hydrogen peroxide-inducible transcriptional activator